MNKSNVNNEHKQTLQLLNTVSDITA